MRLVQPTLHGEATMPDQWQKPLLRERFLFTLEYHGATAVETNLAHGVYDALGPILIWDALEHLLLALELTHYDEEPAAFRELISRFEKYAAHTPPELRTDHAVRAIGEELLVRSNTHLAARTQAALLALLREKSA